MTDKRRVCPCGNEKPMTDVLPPLWVIGEQLWHMDCAMRAMPERRAELEEARARYLREHPPVVVRLLRHEGGDCE